MSAIGCSRSVCEPLLRFDCMIQFLFGRIVLASLLMASSFESFGCRHVMAADPPAPGDVRPTDKEVLTLTFEKLLDDNRPELGELSEGAKISNVGPNSSEFEGQPASNRALLLDGRGSRLRIADSTNETSALDFTLGDAITLEAWVWPVGLGNGANVYVVGKGRTFENGKLENQNYALRLTGSGGEAKASLLFATPKKSDQSSTYHRWTSDLGFVPDGAWHHIAISYRFGSPESIACVVDGEKSKGKWDMGGATKDAPIVDNDSIWIGSSRGGDPGNSFAGAIDDVRIHREIVPVSVLANRRRPIVHPVELPQSIAPGVVTFALHPGLASHAKWPNTIPPESFTFTSSHMALHRLPMRYIRGGIREPWKGPLLLRAYCRTTFEAGELEVLVRSPGLARLWIDGEVVVATPAHRLFPDAHHPFIVYQPDHPWLHVPRISDNEVRKKITLAAGEHHIVLEQIVGAKGIRCETGDTTVAIRRGDELFTLVGPEPHSLPLSDDGWNGYRTQFEQQITAMEQQLRRSAMAEDDEYWNERHEFGRRVVAEREPLKHPEPMAGALENNLIDRYINRRLPEAARHADHLASDSAFLRRLYLDTVGVLPTARETASFMADTDASKRAKLVDRLIEDPRWADRWVSMWQDILAENPSLLKPTLNNTGPFRYFIHDALVENKPMDRFVTELIRMEGDKLGGGAAGFGMASENDVPMAAKAHVLTGAFLAIEMKCARCHDAPYHPWTQKELFSLAAMLDNKPIKVPPTSSVPKEFFERKKGDSPISLSIFPGDVIDPNWSFEELCGVTNEQATMGRDDSTRERLAALITHPKNDRFAKVLVNRLWNGLMGWGLVGNLDDWYEQTPRDPELLEALSREFVVLGYDWKKMARMILNSRAYQRVAIDGEHVDRSMAFTAPWVRRMTAEQVVDSLHAACGIPLSTEELTFDPAGQQHDDAFLNLGVARRSWELTTLSNERDRPSLSLPRAGMIVECLEAFGWRGSRQDPTSHRETAANMVQPGVVANGSMGVRLTRLSDDAVFTQMALEANSAHEFVEQAFMQLLTRMPTEEEAAVFVKQLEPGFETRVKTLALPSPKPKVHRGFVDWANHFDTKANLMMREVEREVAAGPEPTQRLASEWRQRAEDALWAVMNSPEFQFIP